MTALPNQASPVRSGPALLQEAVALNGFTMFITSGAPGMVLVVVRGPDTTVQVYGNTSTDGKSEANAKSLLRLGSVTKVFAGEVLAAMVNNGKVRLTDPLTRYAQGATVPSFGERQITLLDLATHSAGLPREAGEIPPKRCTFTWPTRANSGTGSPNRR